VFFGCSGSLEVKQGRCLEGKHGICGHESICQRDLWNSRKRVINTLKAHPYSFDQPVGAQVVVSFGLECAGIAVWFDGI
jgi:hypothetical protein